MKALILVIVATAVLLTGCGKKNSGSSAPSTNSTAGATNGSSINYLGTLMQADKNMTKTIDVSYLNQAVQLFNTQEGRYPKDLQELVPNYVAKIPDAPYGYKITYDADNGTVKVVNQ